IIIDPLYSNYSDESLLYTPSVPTAHQKATTLVVWRYQQTVLYFICPHTRHPLPHTHYAHNAGSNASRSTMGPCLVLGWDYDRICFCWSVTLEQVTTKNQIQT